MKKTTGYLFVGLFAVGSFIALGACGDDTDTGGEGGSTASTSDAASTGGSPTSSASTGGGGSGGGAALTCDDYCTAITANCADANAQYSTKESCMGSCKAFDEGKATDTSGNTLGCRIYHAGAAKMDAATHCVHAGPGGAGACGTNCEGLCAIAVKTCTGANELWADAAACMTDCMAFADQTPYNAKVTSGDSLACRLYHLTVASTDTASADTHCSHGDADNSAADEPCK